MSACWSACNLKVNLLSVSSPAKSSTREMFIVDPLRSVPRSWPWRFPFFCHAGEDISPGWFLGERLGAFVGQGHKRRPPIVSPAELTPCLRTTPPLDLSPVCFLNCRVMFVFVKLLRQTSPYSKVPHMPIWSPRNASGHAAFEESRSFGSNDLHVWEK